MPYATLQDLVDRFGDEVTQLTDLLDSGAENIHAVVTAAGIEISLEAVQQIMACTDISDDQAEVAFERLGVQTVQEGVENV